MTLGVVAVLAPSFTVAWLWLSALCLAAAWLTFTRARERLLPPRPEPDELAGALRADTPAVVTLLTNDATVTASGFRATMIDLAARGWLRILPPEDDLEELARVRPAATAYHGDALRPHERLVLQHVLSRFTTDRAIPARYLAVDIRGSWWRRFSGLVLDEAVQSGLVRRRWGVSDLVMPGAVWAASAVCWLLARGTGDTDVAVIDSVSVRIAGWTLVVLLAAGLAVAVRLRLQPPYTHTDEGIRAALEIRRDHPDIAVLVLSQYVEERYAGELLTGDVAGVGYLLKDRVIDVDDFLVSVRRVANGGSAIDAEVVSQILGRSQRSSDLDRLTPREREVLTLMAEGLSNGGIADRLVVSHGAVEKHISNVFMKLGLDVEESSHRRVLAVLTYLRGT